MTHCRGSKHERKNLPKLCKILLFFFPSLWRQFYLWREGQICQLRQFIHHFYCPSLSYFNVPIKLEKIPTSRPDQMDTLYYLATKFCSRCRNLEEIEPDTPKKWMTLLRSELAPFYLSLPPYVQPPICFQEDWPPGLALIVVVDPDQIYCNSGKFCGKS